MGGRRALAKVGVALLAAGPLVALQAAPAWAAPAVTASPSTGLVDAQTITVSGSGFPASTSLAVAQCGPGGEATASDCDLRNFRSTSTDAAGSFSTTLVVRRVLETSRDGRIDCATAPAGTCVVSANQFGSGPTASAAVAFDPNVPPLPDLEISVEVTSARIEDNQVLLQGVVRCNRPSGVFLEGRVRQVVRRFFIDGTFFAEVDCDGEEPFSVAFEGRNGELRRGDAELLLDAFGSDATDSDQFSLRQEIELQPK